MSPSVHQLSYDLLCEALRGVVVSGMECEIPVGSVEVRAVAALYELLKDHPIDRRGRCRSCRRPGGVIGLRRRRCRVHRSAHFYLHHPDDAFFLSHLAGEVGVPALAVPGVESGAGTAPGGGTDETDVLPAFVTDSDDHPTGPQSPVLSFQSFLSDGFPEAGTVGAGSRA